MRLRLAVAMLFLAVSLCAVGQVINAPTCSASDVQAAFNAVTASTTTVNIPAGTCNWTTTVTLNVPSGSTTLSVLGAGNLLTNGGGDQTNIVDNDTTDANPILVVNTNATTGSIFRMAGITLKGGTGQTKYSGLLIINGSSQNVRLDHNHFNTASYSPLNDSAGARLKGCIYGVADHNIFDGRVNGVNNGIQEYQGYCNGDSSGFGAGAWNDNTNLGTANSFYIENNVFNNGAANDCLYGGRFVFRFNTSNTTSPAPTVQTHATGSTPDAIRGCRSWEIYKNTATAQPGNYMNTMFFVDAGTGVVWGNTVPSSSSGGGTGYKAILDFRSDRSDNSDHPSTATPNGFGYCGTNYCTAHPSDTVGCPSGGSTPPSVWDQNSNTGTGYRCMDQPGTGKGDLLSGDFPSVTNSTQGFPTWPRNALEPVYEWGDIYSPVPSNPSSIAEIGNGSFVQNTDYYLGTQDSGAPIVFNGTSGVGSGVLASRPSSCTTGVAYWATDQGSWNTSGSGGQGVLYKCTSTNTWSAFYTPYTYPHPLIGGGAGGISLTVSVTGTGATGSSVSGTNSTSGSYTSGTTIGPLTANAGTGTTFTGWAVTGNAACSGTTNPCPSFSLTAATTVSAAFSLNSYVLSTATAGTGSGTITGCAGSHNYSSGYSCAVTPATGSTLASVTGCGGVGTTTYTGTMPASACTVTATFSINSYSITTTTTGTGTGTISGCAGLHVFGTSYSCTITPTGGSTITSVSGCSGTGTSLYTGTMPAANCTVTASLAAAPTSTLTVTTAGTGSGTLGGTNCSSGTYPTGTTITCTETPSGGSTFAGWGGACSGTGACTFPLNSNLSVTATFNIVVSTVATPVFNPAAGSFALPQRVKITDSTSGAILYYTVDGSTPTTSSQKYSHQLYVQQPQNICVLATAAGFTNAPITCANYTIAPQKMRVSASITSASSVTTPFPQDNRLCCGTSIDDLEHIQGVFALTNFHNWITQSQNHNSTTWFTVQGFPTWMTGLSAKESAPPTDLHTVSSCPAVGSSTTDCMMKTTIIQLLKDRTGLSTQPSAPVTCNNFDDIEPINEFNTDSLSGSSTGWTGTYSDLAAMSNDISTLVHTWCSNTIVHAGSASAIVGFHANGENAHFDVALETLLADWAAIPNASLPDAVSYHPYPARQTVSPVPFPDSITSASDSACTGTSNPSCYKAIKDQAPLINSTAVLQNPAIASWASKLPIRASEGSFGQLQQLCALTNGSALCKGYTSEYLLWLASQNVELSMLYAADDCGLGTSWGCFSNNGASPWFPGLSQTMTWLNGHTITSVAGPIAITNGNKWVFTLDGGSSEIDYCDANLPTTCPVSTTFAAQQDLSGAITSTGGTVSLSKTPIMLLTLATTATPSITPVTGSYIGTQTVSITDATTGSVIHYTTDGSTPTTSSTTYTGSFTVSATTTVKALATATGFLTSGINSATITIGAPPPAPPTITGNTTWVNATIN